LAQPLETDEMYGAMLNVVEFRLGAETYAFPLSDVKEVGALEELTLLPGAPSFVLGITNFRGKILSVLDLAQLLGIPNAETTPFGNNQTNWVVLLSNDSMEFGIFSEEIIQIHAIPENEIQSSLMGMRAGSKEYFKGVTPSGLVILDGHALLHDSKLIVNQEI